MKVQVLGSGCPTCKKLLELTKKAVDELKLDEEVEYLSGKEGIQRIIELGETSSPVLAVDDKPILTGFVDNVERIKDLIREAEE